MFPYLGNSRIIYPATSVFVSHAQMACLEMQLEDEWRSELEEELLELQKQRAVQVTKYAYMYAR